MDFVETVELELPDISEQLAAFSEGEGSHHGLIIEIAAIHEGLTANNNFYSGEALEEALQTWVTPYPKPILLHHDQECDPIGRVMAAKMDKEDDGTSYVRLQAAITDPEAIKKIADKRYLTGSIGGKAGEATCSICNANWSNASAFELPCKHRRGGTYKGKMAFMNMKKISNKEYSFVNSPADSKSGVRPPSLPVHTGESEVDDDGWVRARVFDINMDKEEIVEYTESENRDILLGMKKKDSSPLYLQLKGAFLSAMAVAESDTKESTMSDEDVLAEDEEDDVLSVSELLSEDLARSTGEEEVTEDTDTEDVTENTEDEESVEENDLEASEDEPTDAEEKTSPKPEGQSRPTGDVDPETSDNAPISRKLHEEEEAEDSTEEVAEESSETELNEEIETLESRVEELETQNQTLSEENTRLRQALKRGLAERVVDTKIALHLSEKTRDELLEEHLERSSRSLADTLRDLSTMSLQVDYSNFPTTEGVIVATPDDGDERTFTFETQPEEDEETSPEDIFVDVLMGRKKL